MPWESQPIPCVGTISGLPPTPDTPESRASFFDVVIGLASKGLPPFKRFFAPHRIGSSSHHDQGHLPKRKKGALPKYHASSSLLPWKETLKSVPTPSEAPEGICTTLQRRGLHSRHCYRYLLPSDTPLVSTTSRGSQCFGLRLTLWPSNMDDETG